MAEHTPFSGAASDMVALRVLAPGELALVRVPRPGSAALPLLAGQAAVRVRLVGVCGTDVEIARGDMIYYTSGLARYPCTLGHEWVGDVVALGPGASATGCGIAVGDRVVGECSIGCHECASCLGGAYHRCAARRETGVMNLDGGAAEVVALPLRALHRVSRAVPLRSAALVEPTAVALNGVRLGGVAPGKRVAVVGDGPVGLLLLQVARACGAETVVLVGADDARLALGTILGASAVVDARAAADVPAAVRAACGGHAPDVVLEASGVAAGVNAAVGCAAPGGIIVLQGLCGSSAPTAPLETDRVVVNDLTLRGALGSPGMWPAAIALIEGGRIDPAALVTHELPLSEFARGLDLVRSRAAVKLLLRPPTPEGGWGDESG